jgi:hypothetical protein
LLQIAERVRVRVRLIGLDFGVKAKFALELKFAPGPRISLGGPAETRPKGLSCSTRKYIYKIHIFSLPCNILHITVYYISQFVSDLCFFKHKYKTFITEPSIFQNSVFVMQ